VHLAHYDGYVNPFPTVFYHMQLGPDCRIYMNSNNGTKEWHVIHKPDLKGSDCQFEQHGFHFPVYNTITMPSFPNYRLDVAPVCDPGLVTRLEELSTPLNRIKIYPVPTSGPLWIKLPSDWKVKEDIIIEVIDNLGRSCYKKNVTDANDIITIGLESLVTGVYTVIVISGNLFASQRILKTH
jgi:hypothetical protein